MQPFFEQLTKSRVLKLSLNTEGIICSLCLGRPSRARSTKHSPCCLHLFTLPGESRPIQLQLNKYCRAVTQAVASDFKIKSTQSGDAVHCIPKGFCTEEPPASRTSVCVSLGPANFQASVSRAQARAGEMKFSGAVLVSQRGKQSSSGVWVLLPRKPAFLVGIKPG